MTANTLYLAMEGILGITLFGLIDARLAIAFVCGMIIGGATVYFITHSKGKKVELELVCKK